MGRYVGGASWLREGTGLNAVRWLAMLFALGASSLAGPVRAQDALPAGSPEGPSGHVPRFVEAWSEAGVPLERRVENTRTAALELGLRNVEPAARALLAVPPEGTSRLEAAQFATRLAPDLPAAHMALALARWREGFDPLGGGAAALDAAAAFRRNLAASLWLHATAFSAVGLAVAAGALLYLLLAALGVGREAAHDLGDRLSGEAPDFARAALLCALLLVPAVFGEGLFGLALGCLVVLGAYGDRRRWLTAAIAAVALAGGLHPMLDTSARALVAYTADPVAISAYAAEHGFATPIHLARLQRAAGHDPLAARALAMGMKRTGNLRAADARYAQLMEEAPGDPVLLNNAGNVRLARGDTTGATALYREALRQRPSAATWFNLSQAWGVALNVVELDAALAKAQELDPALVEDLSLIQERAIHFVVDITIDDAVWRARLLAGRDAGGAAADLRRPVAPGPLGQSLPGSVAALALSLVLGIAATRFFRPSRSCQRCSALVCPRCHAGSKSRGVCEACNRLLYKQEGTDPALRAAHAQDLAQREARRIRMGRVASLVIPGVGALLAGRPLHALASCIAATSAIALFVARHGVAPDPLSAGAAGPALFGSAAVLAALAYALLLAPVLPSRGGELMSALRGELCDFGIAEVFQLIGQQRKTGALEIAHGEDRVRLLFDGGAVVTAEPVVGAPDGALADMLLRCGLVTRERLLSLRREMETSLCRLGALVVQREVLQPEALLQIEDLLTQDTLFQVLRWTDGSFAFTAGPVEHERAGRLLAAEQILMDGLRMVDEWHTFADRVPPDEAVFQRVGRFEDWARAREAEGRSLETTRRIFQLVDGRLSVRRVIDLARQGTFEAMRVLTELQAAGLIEALDANQVARSRPSPRLELRRPALRPLLAAALPVLLLATLALGSLRARGGLGDAESFAWRRQPLREARVAYEAERVRRALEAYRFARGRWPETLDELVGAGLLEPGALTPSEGRPYYYARWEDDAVLLAPEH